MLKRLSIQTKVLLMLLVTSIMSVIVVGVIGHQSGEESLRTSVVKRLEETRDLQARQLTISMNLMTMSILNYADGGSARDATEQFSRGFDELNAGPPLAPDRRAALAASYQKRLGDRRTDTGTEPDLDALVPRGRAALTLQESFLSPDGITTSGPGPTTGQWATAQARFDSFFTGIVRRNIYDDLLLIDPRGDVVYSVDKGVELGTNILTGPSSGGLLDSAFTDALDSTWTDHVSVSDFEYYLPAGRSVAWFVARIGPKERPVGAIAIRFPAAEIDRIMNFGNAWSKYGLGRTGETIVAGSDQVMRSNSRVLIEDPKRYESEVVAAGTPLPVAQRAVRLKSTILVQPVGPAGALLVGGKPGTLTAEDYLGKTSLQAYTPINLRDLEWTVIAKIDTAEAFAPVTTFTRRVVLSAVALIFLVCLASLFLARYLVRPVRELEEGTRKVAAGELGTTVDIASNDEFGDLATAFNDMSRTLEVKEQLLQEQRAENDRLLLQMMPGALAERYRAGESTIYSEHDDVTVLFAEFDGLDDLVTEMGSQSAIEFLNQLVREFDGAAERLGVEKVRTMRNGYLASCGLTIPRLDNARRTVDFAIEMEKITARLGADSPVHIGVRVGIDTGTVTSGIVGRTALAFDMWGAAVNLAQSAGHGGRSPGVYVTDRVRHSLGESEEFEPAGSVDASGTSIGVWRLREGAQ